MAKIIIISISSDIGTALAAHWRRHGHNVAGTFRTPNAELSKLSDYDCHLIHCDLLDKGSIDSAVMSLLCTHGAWDVLVVAPGTQDPVGPFAQCDFENWSKSVHANFISQLRMVHQLIPHRNTSGHQLPLILFFAGGGTNNATLNYSAYTVSKIALMKMTELLDAEIDNARFCILGPGWVKTKIHNSTIEAGDLAGSNYSKTLTMLEGEDCVPMEKVIACCDWLLSAPRDVISGRNFSVKFDNWGDENLSDCLRQDGNMYKLRRSGNELFTKKN
jgi:NAD(P)-dependent dehydrogenase (short-subunit alcohol dehydrogenase family)